VMEALRWPRSSSESRNWKRRMRGSRVCAHRCWGYTGRPESRRRRKVMATGSGKHGSGAPEVARRREQAGHVRLDLAELRALSSSPGGAPLRQIDGSQHRLRRCSARLPHRQRGASRSDGRLGHAAHGGSLIKSRRCALAWGPRERTARRRPGLELGLMSSSGMTEGRLWRVGPAGQRPQRKGLVQAVLGRLVGWAARPEEHLAGKAKEFGGASLDFWNYGPHGKDGLRSLQSQLGWKRRRDGLAFELSPEWMDKICFFSNLFLMRKQFQKNLEIV
jgi:hypothetical protein